MTTGWTGSSAGEGAAVDEDGLELRVEREGDIFRSLEDVTQMGDEDEDQYDFNGGHTVEDALACRRTDVCGHVRRRDRRQKR